MSKKQSVSEIPVTSEPATKRPELTGDLTVGRYQDKRKVGTISLWIQTANLGTSKPVFQGNVNVDGAKSYVVAWLHGYHLVKDE